MSIRKLIVSQPFLITANVLSGFVAVVVIGLVSDNLAYVRTGSARNGIVDIAYNVTVNDTQVLETSTIALTPLDYRVGSYWLMLAAGIGGFLDAILLGGTLCWRRLKSAEIQEETGEPIDYNLKPQTPLAIFIASFAFCRALAATIYSWYDWAASGTFNPSSSLRLNAARRYKRDFFTPDAWNCQLEDYIPSDAEMNKLENLCREGTAARTMTLALTILAALVLYSVVYRTYRRRQAARAPTPVAIYERGSHVRAASRMSDARTVVAEEKHMAGSPQMAETEK